MLRDCLVVAYLTVICCWYFSLPMLALAAWWFLHIRWRVTGVVVTVLFVLSAIAAWQFEHYR